MGDYANCTLLKPALIRRIKSCAYLFLKFRLALYSEMCRQGWKQNIAFIHLRGAAGSPPPYCLHLMVRPLGYQRRCLRAVFLAKSGAHQSGPGLGDRLIIILTIMKRSSLPSHVLVPLLYLSSTSPQFSWGYFLDNYSDCLYEESYLPFLYKQDAVYRVLRIDTFLYTKNARNTLP